MSFALVIAAFFIGAAVVDYMRDKEADRRRWDEWDRRRGSERRKNTPD